MVGIATAAQSLWIVMAAVVDLDDPPVQPER
jgi:hypothetical protein